MDAFLDFIEFQELIDFVENLRAIMAEVISIFYQSFKWLGTGALVILSLAVIVAVIFRILGR